MMRRREFLGLVGCLLASGAVSHDWLAARADGQPFDMYLTFDDGPSSHKDFKTGPTDIVLQTLKDNNVSATFFLHGLHINDWDGPVMVRYLTDGHAIGNHTWRQGGNTTLDHPTRSLLTQQYLQAEVRIRDILQQTDPTSYNQYMQQPKLFRRPGGNNGLDDFLAPDNFYDLAHDPYLRIYWDKIEWLNGVYDYSGWHINGGESIPVSIRPETPEQELIRSLPRPTDKPNAKTVGIGYAPTFST